MTPERWTLALETGEFELPQDGDILVMRAQGDADFSSLGPDRVLAVQGFFPDHARLDARGIKVTCEAEGQFAAAVVQIVKSKALSLSLIAEAVAHVEPGGIIAVDGQKTEGIESLLKAVRKLVPVDGSFSKSHGKLFWFVRPDIAPEEMIDWIAAPGETEDGFVTAPGMFSPDGPDTGSEILSALVPQLKGHVADLGAGWGYLPAVLLPEQPDIKSLDLIEAEFLALEMAKINVDDPRAGFIWGDATTFETKTLYDAIISNPPFHTARASDPALGQAFIAAAARLLKPSGRFYMVANRHLPYESTLKDHFATGRMLGELHGFKVYEAAKPKTSSRR